MMHLPLVLLALVTSPALAQHEAHTQATTPEAGHSAHGGAGDEPVTAPDPHADHDMHQMPEAAIPEFHGGHDMGPEAQAPAADPHAGHGVTGPGTDHPPRSLPPAQALSGPAHAADRVFGEPAMADARIDLRRTHGGLKSHKVLLDRLETSVDDGGEAYLWDAQLWYGGDIDKLWLKSEGEGTFADGLGGVEFQALWSRAIDPWFDLQLGLRQDVRRGHDATHLALGVQGLAPYWFETEAALFVSTKGDVTARLEAEYDLRITQQLILQPRMEAILSAQDVPELELGAGLSRVSLGARLRYEIVPEFAPYLGVEYERAFGNTRRFRAAIGEDSRGLVVLAGIRSWF